MSSASEADLIDRVARASYESWRSRNLTAVPFGKLMVASLNNARARELLAGLREDAKAVIKVIDEARGE